MMNHNENEREDMELEEEGEGEGEGEGGKGVEEGGTGQGEELSNSSLSPRELQAFLACTLMMCKRQRERPLFTTEAQIFFLDAKTQKSWVEGSSRSVPIHVYHDAKRSSYRIIAVEGSKPVLNGTVDYMVLSKASSKFLKWLDTKTNIVYGLGFSLECELERFMDTVSQVQGMAQTLRTSNSFPPPIEPQEVHENNISASGKASEETLLKLENERLKAALAESCANAKKWEYELSILKEMNDQLTYALNTRCPEQTPLNGGQEGEGVEEIVRQMDMLLSEGLPSHVTEGTNTLQKLETIVNLNRSLKTEIGRLQTESKEWQTTVASIHDQMGVKLKSLLHLQDAMGRELNHSL